MCECTRHSNGFKVVRVGVGAPGPPMALRSRRRRLNCGHSVLSMLQKQEAKRVAVPIVKRKKLIPVSKGKLDSCRGLGSRERPGCLRTLSVSFFCI